MNPELNNVFRWAVENSASAGTPENGPRTQLNPESVAAIFGALSNQVESPTKVMERKMAVMRNPEAQIESRKIAFEDYELIISQHDMANCIENLVVKEDVTNEDENAPTIGHWMSLKELLEDENSEIRSLAAGCCGTAVSNNPRTQERLLIIGAIPNLVRLATGDDIPKHRKRAVTALSVAVRNFQPGLDAAVSQMPKQYKPQEKLDASDMESVDILINKLRSRL
ncbi:Hsp70 nucleotide exchange factor FES1 [Phaeosphaeriaceae sp. PMI808]|nr:Hsp70 nucleotide exchange factor FES1 [Phaeosphaeriaceae sp. PMI808]